MSRRGSALVAALLLSGCAHRIANQASTGMLTALQQQQADADPNQQVARVMGERAATGALGTLDEPEQRERIRRMIDESVRQAVTAAFSTALTPPDQVGDDGVPRPNSPAELLAVQLAHAATASAIKEISAALGPKGALSASLVDASGRVSASVIDTTTARLGEIFPGCSGPNAQSCREERLRELSRAAGAGFSKGVREVMALPMILMATLIGIAVGAAGHRAWTSRRTRLRLRTA
jgi:hypothetical protein